MTRGPAEALLPAIAAFALALALAPRADASLAIAGVAPAHQARSARAGAGTDGDAHARRHPRPGQAARDPPGTERFTLPPFGEVTLYVPDGPVQSVALLLSGDGGWEPRVVAMAKRLRAEGALVAGVTSTTYGDALEHRKAACAYPAGDLEELARAVELRHGLPAYRKAELVGFSSGATFVYVALAQAPSETFAGGLSLGFCPDIELTHEPCRGRALALAPRPPVGKRATGPAWNLVPAPALGVPWTVLHGDLDKACSPELARSFVAKVADARFVPLAHVGHGFGDPSSWQEELVGAYRALAARADEPAPPPPPPVVPDVAGSVTPSAGAVVAPEVADLPLVAVPATGGARGDVLAVFLSGDGGWAEIDRRVSEELAAAGIPVVGWNSLRYYWTPRTPDAAAADLARILTHALGAWQKERVVLVGYSFGADVLPFLVSRLPADLRAKVAGVALIGLGENAEFEFHVLGWAGHESGPPYPTLQEIASLSAPVVCLHGADESDSPCRALRGSGKTAIALPGGHHMKGDYARIAHEIESALLARATGARAPATSPPDGLRGSH